MEQTGSYRRDWPAYNTAQSEEKSRFVALLADLCNTIPQPQQSPGAGRPRLPLSDMVFASVFKVYVGFSSRRFTCDLHDAYADGLIDTKPHFNSVSRYLSDPALTDALKYLVTLSSLPLKAVESDFAVDSSGFSTSRFVRWYSKKHGRVKDNREWVKVHLMCGVNTKTVTSVEVSGWTAHDTNYFVPLVERTAGNFQLGDVLADKAYLSRYAQKLWIEDFLRDAVYLPFRDSEAEVPTRQRRQEGTPICSEYTKMKPSVSSSPSTLTRSPAGEPEGCSPRR
jgi:hypothetical protein